MKLVKPFHRLFQRLLPAAVAAAFVTQASAAVITSVTETGGDGAPTVKFTGQTFTGALGNNSTYTVPTFGVLAKTYTDRLHAYTNASGTVAIPSYLLGNEYIMVRNDTRDNTGFRIDVTVSQDVLVYVLVDNRLVDGANGNPPFNATPNILNWPNMTWMGSAGFRPVTSGQNRTANSSVPDEVGIDEGADGTINNWFSVYSNRYPAGTFSLFQQGLTGNNMYGVVVQGVAPTAPPTAPTNVVAVNFDSAVTLTWNAVSGAASYFVKRSSTQGGPYDVLTNIGGATFTDSNVVNGQTYYYVVSGTNQLGEGPNSVEVIGQPNPIVTGITAVGGTNQITVSWSALANTDSYGVLRSTNSNSGYTAVASGLVDTTYVDSTVLPGRTYFYRISGALTGGGTSGQSGTASANATPSTPVAIVTSFSTVALKIAWTNADLVVPIFILESSSDGETFTPLATFAGTVRHFLHTNLAPATTQFYRLQASNSAGFSSYSVIASNTTLSTGIFVNFGAGTNNSANVNIASPVPPGYLNDIGDVFGDRGNGFFYGWTNAAGTNITRDARYRQNANSPDIRYDTFNHMQRPGPQTWEIEIPNGFYAVRLVAGDVSATDSTFQFNVEGVVTATNFPVVGAWWVEYNLQLGVSDGRLTITTGPQSANGKINFVEIVPATPTLATFTLQPQSVQVEEARPAGFTAAATGSVPLFYQWYFNDAEVPGANGPTLSFTRAQLTDAGTYYLVVTNYAGRSTSDIVSLTVDEDVTPPSIVSAGSLDGTTIAVVFDEEVASASANEPSNYGINGGAVDIQSVTLRPDNRSVILYLLTPISGPFTVSAFDMTDISGVSNPFTETNSFVVGLTPLDIGGPAFLGTNYTGDSQTIEIVAGGADIWGASDQGYIATKPVGGDFDVRVRVNSLTRPDNIAKAVIVARDTTDANSRGIHISVNPPPPGRNQIEMGLRPENGSNTVAVGTSFIPAGIPNAWMRLQRLGNVFTGFRSTNGIDWIVLGQTNYPLAATLQVGIGATAHTNSPSLSTTATFSSLQFLSPTLVLRDPAYTVDGFTFAFESQTGTAYEVQFKNSLSDPLWQTFTNVNGTGGLISITNAPGEPHRFFRAIVP